MPWRWRALLALATMPWLAPLPAVPRDEPPPVRPDKDAGQALAAELRSLRPDTDQQWSGVMKIRARGRKMAVLPITCRTTIGETTWRVTYRTPGNGEFPAEELIVVRALNAPTEYHHARATKPGEALPAGRALPTAEAWVPFAGSDFLLTDLGLEFLQWPGQQVLNPGRNEMRRSRVCQVLESANPRPSPGAHVRVVSWIDKEERGILQAEAYDTDQKLVKEFAPGSFKKVNGTWQLQDMEMRSPRTGGVTVIEFDLPSG